MVAVRSRPPRGALRNGRARNHLRRRRPGRVRPRFGRRLLVLARGRRGRCGGSRAVLARLDGVRMSTALPLSPSRGMNRVIARPTFPPKVTVSDKVGRPLSRRSRGASEVRRRPAADAPVTGVPPKDLAAPVPAGAVLLLGSLFYPRACLRRQAVGRRAPVCVPASSSHLPHLTPSVASIFLKHGGLTECGQSRGVVAQ